MNEAGSETNFAVNPVCLDLNQILQKLNGVRFEPAVDKNRTRFRSSVGKPAFYSLRTQIHVLLWMDPAPPPRNRHLQKPTVRLGSFKPKK